MPVKKQLEVLLMQYFSECYTDFPKGKVISSESPDFIITLKSRNNIGIELTRLNPVNARIPDSTELAQNELNEYIIETAKSLFENNSPYQLFVKFLFSEPYPLSKNHVEAQLHPNIFQYKARSEKY